MTTDPEILYSPSYWSKRLGRDVIVEQHFRVTTEESRRVKATIPRTTHHYGPGNSMRVDIFEASLSDAPILVFFSGGYWAHGSGEISAFTVQPFHQENISVAVVHYDRAPKVTLTKIVEEAILATKLILELAKKNSRKVFLSGHSAGAHLCAMVFASSWFGDLPKVDKNLFGGVFYFAGIYDLRPLLTTTYNDPLGLDENSVIEVSPMLLVEKMSSNFKCEEILMKRCKFKVKVICGEHDSPALNAQGKEFHKELETHGFGQACLVCIDGKDHFDLVEKLSETDYKLTQLMLKCIKEC